MHDEYKIAYASLLAVFSVKWTGRQADMRVARDYSRVTGTRVLIIRNDAHGHTRACEHNTRSDVQVDFGSHSRRGLLFAECSRLINARSRCEFTRE